jgi:cold shock CspA family protein
MSDEPEKPLFFIQRKRLGRIRHLDEKKKFGFIDAEDFREDVFFHLSQWESQGPRDRGPRVGQFVEFELDELHRHKENKLRANIVRMTARPDGDRLNERGDPRLVAQHHPRARKRKPAWRRKDEA